MVNNIKLRAMREEKNITQEELAEAALVSRTMITHIERGAKQPGIDALQRIAAYFDCAIDDLVMPLHGEGVDTFCQ